MNIYVGNLPYKVRNEELRDAFEEFGEVYWREFAAVNQGSEIGDGGKGQGFVHGVRSLFFATSYAARLGAWPEKNIF